MIADQATLDNERLEIARREAAQLREIEEQRRAMEEQRLAMEEQRRAMEVIQQKLDADVKRIEEMLVAMQHVPLVPSATTADDDSVDLASIPAS